MIYKPTSFKYLSGVCLFVIGRISTLKATCFLRIQALQRKAATRCLVFWEENLSLFYLILPESPTKSRRRGRGKFSLLFSINDSLYISTYTSKETQKIQILQSSLFHFWKAVFTLTDAFSKCCISLFFNSANEYFFFSFLNFPL